MSPFLILHINILQSPRHDYTSNVFFYCIVSIADTKLSSHSYIRICPTTTLCSTTKRLVSGCVAMTGIIRCCYPRKCSRTWSPTMPRKQSPSTHTLTYLPHSIRCDGINYVLHCFASLLLLNWKKRLSQLQFSYFCLPAILNDSVNSFKCIIFVSFLL